MKRVIPVLGLAASVLVSAILAVQQATVLAVFAYHGAMRDGKLPRNRFRSRPPSAARSRSAGFGLRHPDAAARGTTSP